MPGYCSRTFWGTWEKLIAWRSRVRDSAVPRSRSLLKRSQFSDSNADRGAMRGRESSNTAAARDVIVRNFSEPRISDARCLVAVATGAWSEDQSARRVAVQ